MQRVSSSNICARTGSIILFPYLGSNGWNEYTRTLPLRDGARER